MKNLLFITGFFCAISLLASCDFLGLNDNKTPLVKVFDKYLYAEDIRDIVPEGTSPADSAVKVSNFIDIWVKKQLLMKKAELYLDDQQKDVKQQLEDYRTSLLIYKYKELFLMQKLDTTIANKEIEEYYLQHAAEFKLTSNAVKGMYIKISKNNADVDKIKSWYRSKDPRDSVQLYEFCKANTNSLANFSDDWMYLSDIMNDIPTQINDQTEFLKTKKFLESEDDQYYYFLRIDQFRTDNDIAPLNFVKQNISSILLNRRKVLLLNELENTIYQNAINQGNLEFYYE